MKKINKKLIVPSLLSLTLLSSAVLCSYAFAQVVIEKDKTTRTNNELINWSRQDEVSAEARYVKDALLKDAQEKAATTSVLFYKITNPSVITRFSFISHIMKILELNPDKRVHIQAINTLNLDMGYFEQYPNVVYDVLYETVLTSYTTYEYNLDPLQDIYDSYGEDQAIDGYFDDFTYVQKIGLYLRGFNTPLDRLKIYNEFILLGKLDTINFFPDGTKSVEYFIEFYKKAFMLSNNLYDPIEKNYTNAKLMREGVKQGLVSKEEFLKGNNALLFLTSMLTMDFKDPNKSKYFLPTTGFISEVNREGENPNFKNTNEGQDFFSPYNSQNIDIINFMKSLNQVDLRNILKIKADFNPEFYIQQMNNNKNYIYSGGKMNDQARIDNNVKVLVAIKNYASKQHPGQEDQVIVWFKGHPSDNDILEKLQNRIQVLYPGDKGEWIKVLDHQVPFEFYSIYDVFASDPLNNKEVYLFSTYSTLVMMMYASGQEKDIVKIIIDPTTIYSIERIKEVYGSDSKIFSGKKLTTLADFEKQNQQ